MLLEPLINNISIQEPDKEIYCSNSRPPKIPPLNTSQLSLEPLIKEERNSLKAHFAGVISLLLRYKNKEGAIMSIDELNNGEEWKVVQVQGCKSKSSYRVASSLYWQNFLSDYLKQYAVNDYAEVRRITMPSICNIAGIEDAVSQCIERNYAFVVKSFGMRFSKEAGLFVVDTKNLKGNKTMV
ncbi:hypothetical protein HON22_05430 [Candidatus Peregrinibacteria bacterium]|jgi:hypothetical protein|nr:hypothetical protein [Candidatus Peregrinibacteria bacterium]